MKRIHLFILVSLLLSSCSLLHYMTVKDATYENKQVYNQFLLSQGVDTSYSYQLSKNYFDSISSKNFAINTYKLKYGTNASPVQIRMYDKKGKLINAYEQCFGEIKKLGQLTEFPMKKIEHLPINYDLYFANDLQLLELPETEKQQLITTSQSMDYTIVVYYTKWIGWYSKSVLKELNKYIQKNNPSRILFMKVNTTR